MKTITEEIQKKMNWESAFLCDLHNWIEYGRISHVSKLINEVDKLWKKYENVISKLADKWNKFRKEEQLSYYIYNFLTDLGLW
uniref:Uncharacterized protein n=1 Tax=Pithovirus LCPAC401 TaxID=2506595 RepID=A0A481Z9G0_9VIRU|nr:MAG: hypothetical protein LCPAC401_01620 [Pithovirus LCPAC401]